MTSPQVGENQAALTEKEKKRAYQKVYQKAWREANPEYGKSYRAANLDSHKAREKARYQNNKASDSPALKAQMGKQREYQKTEKCKEYQRAYQAEYRKTHKGRMKELSASNYQKNRDTVLSRKREYRKSHRKDPIPKTPRPPKLSDSERKAKAAARAAKRYAKNRESPEWMAAHIARAKRDRLKPSHKAQRSRRERTPQARATRRSAKAKRRALKKGASIGDTKAIKAWVKSWRILKRVVCHWCNNKVKPNDAHIDHITPLAKGGNHALTNLCVSCSKCNCSKGAKNPSEWNASLKDPVLFF